MKTLKITLARLVVATLAYLLLRIVWLYLGLSTDILIVIIVLVSSSLFEQKK